MNNEQKTRISSDILARVKYLNFLKRSNPSDSSVIDTEINVLTSRINKIKTGR